MDNFKNIKIGDNKAYVISNIGKPSRIDIVSTISNGMYIMRI